MKTRLAQSKPEQKVASSRFPHPHQNPMQPRPSSSHLESTSFTPDGGSKALGPYPCRAHVPGRTEIKKCSQATISILQDPTGQ